MDELVALFRVQEVGEALAPAVLVLDEDLDQLLVVLQLGVDHFDILLVFSKKRSEILKTLLNALGQPSHRLRLGGADPPENALGCEQHFVAEVVPAEALGVGDGVYLAQNLDHLHSFLRVLGRVNDDAALGLLLLLDLAELLLALDGLGDVASGVGLDEHELEHVDLLVGHPGLVELLQVLRHVLHDLLHRHVHRVLDDALVDVSNDRLDHPKLLEQLPPRVQNLLREHVLFSVHPQVGESFLRRVKDFGQVAETAFLIENLVCLGELLSVAARGTICLENFAEAFHLV